MKKKKLYIYGVGGFADYASYVFDNDSDFEVKGQCMEKNYLEKNPNAFKDTEIFEEIKEKLLDQNTFLFIAVGNNIIRERIYQTAKALEIKLATYISSKASTWPNLEIGDNCFIGEGSVLQPFVKIGENTILFSTRLGHHTTVGNHVLLSAPVTGGNVTIGDYSFVGMNAVIQQNLIIGQKNIIGMGVFIKRSTQNSDVYSSSNSIKRKIKFEDISNSYLN